THLLPHLIRTSESDAVTGEFLVCLPAGRDYALNVSREGYLFYSDNFALENEMSSADPFLKDVPLSPVITGERVVLKNIFFETDKYDLKDQSKAELDRLVHLLESNPSLSIEISGHTDNTGNREYNQKLSENRARSVFNYLTESGIQSDRLTYTGFGDSQPLDTNETEQGRAGNRRTEFRVTGQ
ncbi:MAG: OmpA family protein, partial [Bacteroidales bacterium]|nr:OmpA family protein [Bacteroidales bacterium]